MEENKVIDLDINVDGDTEYKEAGEVQIADDVIAVITEIATLEVDGVCAIAKVKFLVQC